MDIILFFLSIFTIALILYVARFSTDDLKSHKGIKKHYRAGFITPEEKEHVFKLSVDCLTSMVNQHCSLTDREIEAQRKKPICELDKLLHELDSRTLSANADAMRLLERLEKIEIVAEDRRKVLGNWRK